MSVFFILIGASLLIAGGFLFAFIRSAKSGQFDDSYTPGVRMLFDDETKQKSKSNNKQ
jgi:cbb3-type cytochrome oxidase maturation protein